VSPLASEQELLLRALARRGVELVVVGGVAAQLHRWRGATADLDIAVSAEDTNVERLNRALATVDAPPSACPAAWEPRPARDAAGLRSFAPTPSAVGAMLNFNEDVVNCWVWTATRSASE
jgi:hypothetical protein